MQNRLDVDWESFRHAGKLQSLSFRGMKTVSLLPDSLVVLPALATLELEDCGIVSIPVALTALTDSLTRLALAANNALQLDSEGFLTLLALRKLRMLDLRKPAPHGPGGAMATQPLNWSPRSVCHLVKLCPAFMEQHGHMPALRVTDDDYD